MLQYVKAKLTEKKGFTLVEMLVVLVILAILAALLLPSFTGYIDKAKEKRVMAEVHQVVTAAQTLADEVYAMTFDKLNADSYQDISIEDIQELSEVTTISEVVIKASTGKVVYVKIESGGITGVYGNISNDDDNPVYEIRAGVASETTLPDKPDTINGDYATILDDTTNTDSPSDSDAVG